MIAIGFGLVWGAYALGLKGWSLLQGWDVTFGRLVSPVAWYDGPWPPPQIPAGQLFASKGGAPGPAAKTPPAGASVKQTLQENMPKAGA